ncbi:MAG: retropepsin-like aspartic protease [bacterium]
MSPWRISGKFQRDGLLILPALLNGGSFKLLFDPGAAYSAITPDIAALLELRIVGSRRLLQGGYHDISCPVFQVESFQIGFIRRMNMRLVGMPLDAQLNFDGIIGMDFLRQYRFTVEPDSATLILRPLRK